MTAIAIGSMALKTFSTVDVVLPGDIDEHRDSPRGTDRDRNRAQPLQALIEESWRVRGGRALVGAQVRLDARELVFHYGVAPVANRIAEAGRVSSSLTGNKSTRSGDLPTLPLPAQFASRRPEGDPDNPSITTRKGTDTMNTNVALENTIVEQTQEADVTELVELALSDLDAIGGGLSLGAGY